MDLNHMELPSSLLTDFYKTHLIENAAIKQMAKIDASPVIATGNNNGLQFLGKNKKGVCILVEYAKDVYLPDDQLHFLTTILQACHLNLGDVAIINCYREKISFEELSKQITCNHLLIFGVDTASVGVEDIPLFSISNINGCAVVYSPAAEALNNKTPESKLLKTKLWGCLKQMFNV